MFEEYVKNNIISHVFEHLLSNTAPFDSSRHIFLKLIDKVSRNLKTYKDNNDITQKYRNIIVQGLKK